MINGENQASVKIRMYFNYDLNCFGKNKDWATKCKLHTKKETL